MGIFSKLAATFFMLISLAAWAEPTPTEIEDTLRKLLAGEIEQSRATLDQFGNSSVLDKVLALVGVKTDEATDHFGRILVPHFDPFNKKVEHFDLLATVNSEGNLWNKEIDTLRSENLVFVNSPDGPPESISSFAILHVRQGDLHLSIVQVLPFTSEVMSSEADAIQLDQIQQAYTSTEMDAIRKKVLKEYDGLSQAIPILSLPQSIFPMQDAQLQLSIRDLRAEIDSTFKRAHLRSPFALLQGIQPRHGIATFSNLRFAVVHDWQIPGQLLQARPVTDHSLGLFLTALAQNLPDMSTLRYYYPCERIIRKNANMMN